MQIRCVHIKNLETQETRLFIWADSGLLDISITFFKTSAIFLKILMPPGWQQNLFKWQLSQTVFEKSSTQPEDCSRTRQIYVALIKEKKKYINTLSCYCYVSNSNTKYTRQITYECNVDPKDLD